MEEVLADAVEVGGVGAVDGLAVHGLPQGARLDIKAVETDAHGLYIGVGLAVGGGGACLVDDSGGSSHGAADDALVGLVLSLDVEVGREGDGAEPVVAVVAAVGGLAVDGDARHVGEEALIERLDVLVVRDMVAGDGHLSAADAGADIGHTVVVADGFVLVVGVGLASLGGVPHDALPLLGVGADEGAAAGGGDHLVAVEAEDAVAAEGAEDLSVEAAAETFGGVLDDGDVIALGYLHDAVYLVGHAIEGDGHDGLGLAAGLGDAVADGLFEQVGVDVPRVGLGVNEDGCGAEVGDGVRGGAEGEALDEDFIAGAYATGEEAEVDGGGAGAEGDDALAGSDEALEVFLKLVDVGAQGHYPVGVEGFLHVFLLFTREVAETEEYAFLSALHSSCCFFAFALSGRL